MEKIRQVLFLSVDIAGSTAYKHGQKINQWRDAFSSFYKEFPFAFENSWQQTQKEFNNLNGRPVPLPWKSIGDELVFCSYPQSSFETAQQVRSFIRAINHYGQTGLAKVKDSHKLGLKATAWLAEIPTVNLKIPINRVSHRQDNADENGSDEVSSFADVDFIGPSIDTGFRLTKFATTEKCIVSVELAAILAERWGEEIYFDGLQPMKGVLGETPYPIIWLPLTLHPITQSLRSHISPPAKLSKFCRSFITEEIEQKFELNTYPYFEGDDLFGTIDPKHEAVYQEFIQLENQVEKQSEGYERDVKMETSDAAETRESSAKTSILTELSKIE